jgi:hypothetical protein
MGASGIFLWHQPAKTGNLPPIIKALVIADLPVQLAHALSAKTFRQRFFDAFDQLNFALRYLLIQ